MFKFLLGVAIGAGGLWAWNAFGRDLLGMGPIDQGTYGSYTDTPASTTYGSSTTGWIRQLEHDLALDQHAHEQQQQHAWLWKHELERKRERQHRQHRQHRLHRQYRKHRQHRQWQLDHRQRYLDWHLGHAPPERRDQLARAARPGAVRFLGGRPVLPRRAGDCRGSCGRLPAERVHGRPRRPVRRSFEPSSAEPCDATAPRIRRLSAARPCARLAFRLPG